MIHIASNNHIAPISDSNKMNHVFLIKWKFFQSKIFWSVSEHNEELTDKKFFIKIQNGISDDEYDFIFVFDSIDWLLKYNQFTLNSQGQWQIY